MSNFDETLSLLDSVKLKTLDPVNKKKIELMDELIAFTKVLTKDTKQSVKPFPAPTIGRPLIRCKFSHKCLDYSQETCKNCEHNQMAHFYKPKSKTEAVEKTEIINNTGCPKCGNSLRIGYNRDNNKWHCKNCQHEWVSKVKSRDKVNIVEEKLLKIKTISCPNCGESKKINYSFVREKFNCGDCKHEWGEEEEKKLEELAKEPMPDKED